MRKRTVKKLFAVALAAVSLTGLLTGCGSEKTAENESQPAQAAEETESADTKADDGKTYKIGVIQYVQHEALDASNEGFQKALDDLGINYEIDEQNAAGEAASCQTIAQTLVNDGNDLIFAIATPAAQAVAGETSEIPIVLTAVTDPAGSGLVDTNEAPAGNVTGTSDLTPVKEQIDLLKKILPDAKKVGILFCSAESNSEIQAEMARKACDALGLEHEDYTVSASNEIQPVVESAVGKVDALYAPTDNVIAAGMTTVGMIATDNKIPVICGEEGMTNAGGLATYGINYYELGYKAGEMAAKILTEGADPAEMPIEYLAAEQCALTVNDETAAELGLDLSELK